VTALNQIFPKKFMAVLICITLSSCLTGKMYNMNDAEKEQLKGYHQRTAQEVIEKNKKNRKANQRMADKNRQKQNEQLAELNANTSKVKKKHKPSGQFKFYIY
jgi:hypothetical protein